MAGRRLGQHFLFNPSLLEKIVDAAGLVPSDTVVEVGPGPGRLTRVLAQRVRRVIAIELDAALHERLRREMADAGNVELVHADALLFPYEDIGEFKVVANIPYYITTPLIFRLLGAKKNLRSMTLTVQKEVAERIVACPGGKDYGVLSIGVQFCARPRLVFPVRKESFTPAPKVDSAVLHLETLASPAVDVQDERFFFRVVKTAFAQRRKTLANSLKSLSGDIPAVLIRAGIDPRQRPETLSIEDFARLSNLLRQ